MAIVGNQIRRPSPLQDTSPQAIGQLTAEIRSQWHPNEYEVRRRQACQRQTALFDAWMIDQLGASQRTAKTRQRTRCG